MYPIKLRTSLTSQRAGGPKRAWLGLFALLCGLALLSWSTPAPARADTPDEQLAFASGLYQQKLYSLAADKLREFLKANPQHPKAALASYQLGAALYRATGDKGEPDYAAVAAAYEKALAQPAPTPQIAAAARLELGDAYFNLKRYDQAVKSLTAYLQSTPAPEKENAAWAQYWIAQSLYELKKPAEARAAFEKVVAQYGDNADVAPYAQHALGVLAADAGDAKAAATAFQAVLTRYPQSEIALDARLQLANALLNDKRYTDAQTTYRALLDDPKAAAMKGDALSGLADAYFRAQDFTNAATFYQQALAALPVDAKSRPTLQLQLGNSYYNGKKYAEALKAYAPLLQSADAAIAAPALYYSAGSQSSLKQFNEAATLYSKVVESYPQHELAAKAALRLGDALADAGDNARALAAYQTAATKYPQTDAAKEARAALADLKGEAATQQLAAVQAAYDAKDWAKTAQLAQALLEKKPAPAIGEGTLYLWADAQRQAGDASAAQLFRRQLTDYPQGALADEARLGLTWTLLDAKQWPEAAAAARAALAAAPDDAKTAELRDRMELALGEALLRGGNPQNAAIAFARVEPSANKELAAQAFYGSALALEGAKQWAAAAAKWSQRAEASGDAATKAGSYLRQGLALREAKNGAGALAAFDRALAADPKGEVAAQALYESAWQAHDLKQPNEEAARWKRLAADFPDSKYAAEAAFQQAEVLYDAKSYAEAAAAYRRVLEKSPQSEIAPLAWYKLGSALYNQKDWAEAAPAFDQAAAAKKDFSLESSFWAGESWRQAGKLSEAKTRYAAFLQALNAAGSTPSKETQAFAPRAQLGLGLALAADKDWPGATAAYTAGLKTADGADAAELHYHLGEALAQQNKWKEASTEFLKVSISFPESKWNDKAQWNAAQALEKSGEKAPAVAIYKSLVARQPESAEAKQAQERLKALEANAN
jgi:TolA-binding protein